MNDESKIEHLAWILTQIKSSETHPEESDDSLRDSRTESSDTQGGIESDISDQELQDYREGNRSTHIEVALANNPQLRKRLLQLSQIDSDAPSSVRDKILENTVSKHLRPRIQWAAAIALIGLGLVLAQSFRTAPLIISVEEFSSLEFSVNAQGLTNIRSSDPIDTNQIGNTNSESITDLVPVITVEAYEDTPVTIQVESSLSPSRPVYFALFHLQQQQWIRTDNFDIDQSLGSAVLTVRPSDLTANILNQQSLMIAISHDQNFSTPSNDLLDHRATAASMNRANDSTDKPQATKLDSTNAEQKLAADRLFLVTINIVNPDS